MSDGASEVPIDRFKVNRYFTVGEGGPTFYTVHHFCLEHKHLLSYTNFYGCVLKGGTDSCLPQWLGVTLTRSKVPTSALSRGEAASPVPVEAQTVVVLPDTRGWCHRVSVKTVSLRSV